MSASVELEFVILANDSLQEYELVWLCLNIPKDLATHLQPLKDKLPQVLAMGLRELNALTQFGFEGAADMSRQIVVVNIAWALKVLFSLPMILNY